MLTRSRTLTSGLLTLNSTCYRQQVNEAEFPILGTEPIVVEFTNTLYGADRHDFLSTAASINHWFAQMSPSLASAEVFCRTAAESDRVRRLRDHVHKLFDAATTGAVPASEAVAVVNDFAAAAPPALTLAWSSDGTRRADWVGTAAGISAVLAKMATTAVELLTTPAMGEITRCSGPGCTLLFVRTHARRRFCHPSCGHRDRQARYYRRHHRGVGP